MACNLLKNTYFNFRVSHDGAPWSISQFYGNKLQSKKYHIPENKNQ
jgi:hypothetical protein